MTSYDELRAYLSYRHELLALDVMTVDECDLAVAFHSPDNRALIEQFHNARENSPMQSVVAYLAGTYIDHTVAMSHPKPTDPRIWKRRFYDAAQVLPSSY